MCVLLKTWCSYKRPLCIKTISGSDSSASWKCFFGRLSDPCDYYFLHLLLTGNLKKTDLYLGMLCLQQMLSYRSISSYLEKKKEISIWCLWGLLTLILGYVQIHRKESCNENSLPLHFCFLFFIISSFVNILT